MTKFIVHIGDGKCGSSSIQKSLFEIRKNLRRAGIIYETSAPKNGQFSLVSMIGRRTRGDADTLEKQSRQTLELIQTNLQPSDTVLLSGESFFSVPPDQMMRILEAIDPKIEKLDVVAYVRSPHSMYLSLVQQTIKGSSIYTKPESYVRGLDKVLSNWASFDRADSLTVRHFDRAHLVDGDAVADFEHVLRDLACSPNLHLPRAVENTSLSAEQIVALQHFRAVHMTKLDGKLSLSSNQLIQCFEQMNSAGTVGHKPQLTDLAKSVVCKGNAEIVENVERLFPHLVLDNSSPQPNVMDDPFPWADTDDVRHVLQDCDPELVGQLLKLVPEFENDLHLTMTAEAERAVRSISDWPLADPSTVIDAIRSYWHKSGCVRAAKQVDTLRVHP